MTDLIPVIDLSRELGAVGRDIDDACRRIGFFQVVGHRVAPDVETAMWDAATALFDLPAAIKQQASIAPGDAYGYGTFGAERLAASRGQTTPPDLKETFSIGPFATPASLSNNEAARFVYSPNRWPEGLPDLPAIAERYYHTMADLAARIMMAMAVGLGLDPHHFERSIAAHTSALRMLRYPNLDGRTLEPGQLRAGEHSDYGTLTLLRQDNAPGGLQVRDIDGTWHAVPAAPGAYVVNVGDALERWTNGRWVSTLHRVVVPPPAAAGDATRQSIAFFHNANWDASLACLPTCVDEHHPARFEPITAGQHLMEKFRVTQG